MTEDCTARPLTEAEVKPAVETWVRYVTTNAREDAVIDRMEPYEVSGKVVAYIAYLSDHGFCICGADDRMLPVYIYSPEGTFDPEYEVYRYFLKDMNQWIHAIHNAQINNDPAVLKYSAALDDRAAYWSDLAGGNVPQTDKGLYEGPATMALDMTSLWWQWQPYNEYCPELTPGSDERCALGCVAGSMAAIMRYWEWPETGVGTAQTIYHYRWRNSWDEVPLATNPNIDPYWGTPGIPTGWQNRLEWTAADGGKLRMNGYWDGSLHLAATGTRPTYVFAGTDGGGAYRSTDNGGDWSTINSGLTNTDVNALAINSSDNLFAGTHGGGVYRSADSGSSWTPVNSGLTYSYITALVVNSSDDIFAGTYGAGAYRSTNNGDNWTQINSGLTNGYVNALVINSSGHIFAGTGGGGMYRSTDNGDNWVQINNGLGIPNVRAVTVNSLDYIYVGTSSGMYRSINNGNNWNPINSGLTNTSVWALDINYYDCVFAGTDGGMYRSLDYGDNWEQRNDGLTNLNVRALAINAFDHIFAGTDGGGVYRSENWGDNWSQINNGLTNTSVQALTINCSYHIALRKLYDRLSYWVDDVLDAYPGITTYQWDLMQDVHSDPPDAGGLAVATLCYDAGVSALMGYGVTGSGAGVEPCIAGYVNNFRYNDDMEYVVRDTGNYASGVNDMMDEIQWLRPVQYWGWEHAHSWAIFAYNRTFLPDSVQWGMNSVNGSIDWLTFNTIFANHCFMRKIAPESVVRFVGSAAAGDGSPADPFMNVESAIADAPDGATLIFKAGSDNTFSAIPLLIDRPFLLRGTNAVIRKE
jgi:photosystem II stability/assembly factor-like uncharacterized protein